MSNPSVSPLADLERSMMDVIQDTFGERDADGLLAKATIETPGGDPFEAEYVITEPVRTNHVETPQGTIARREEVAIQVDAADLAGMTPLAERTKVTLYGDETPFTIDDREQEYGDVTVILRLSRKPDVKQTSNRLQRGA